MSKLRILLADDHAMVREGLKSLVNTQPDMDVVGEAGDGYDAIRQTQELLPDVVIMDISMPKMNGLLATEKLKRVCPGVKVLTLTRHADTGFVQQLLRAGASGYILKQSASAELIRAIRAVMAGGYYIDPTVTEVIVSNYTNKQLILSSNQQVSLTEREEEVLRLIAWGYSNKEIASHIQVSVKTVEAHKASCMRKLDLRSRIDIVRYALLKGWLQEN